MYLKELESAKPPESAGRFGRVIENQRKAGKPPPGIYYLFAQRPIAAKHMGGFMQDVMRSDSDLSSGERELIAAWTSARNDCEF